MNTPTCAKIPPRSQQPDSNWVIVSFPLVAAPEIETSGCAQAAEASPRRDAAQRRDEYQEAASTQIRSDPNLRSSSG